MAKAIVPFCLASAALPIGLRLFSANEQPWNAFGKRLKPSLGPELWLENLVGRTIFEMQNQLGASVLAVLQNPGWNHPKNLVAAGPKQSQSCVGVGATKGIDGNRQPSEPQESTNDPHRDAEVVRAVRKRKMPTGSDGRAEEEKPRPEFSPLADPRNDVPFDHLKSHTSPLGQTLPNIGNQGPELPRGFCARLRTTSSGAVP